MKGKLMFDPQSFEKLAAPFSIFIKNDKEIAYQPLDNKNYTQYISESNFGSFKQLTISSIGGVIAEIQVSYHLLKSPSDEKEFLKKHFFQQLYTVFQRLIAGNNLKNVLHKYQSEPRRFRIQPCQFKGGFAYQLSFLVKKVGSKLKIDTFIELNGFRHNLSDFNRFHFFLYRDDVYYLLKKTDWQLIDEIEKSSVITYSDYIETFSNRLKPFKVDLSGVFEEKVIEIEPDTIIHISELGGDMLLFLPKWEYDGHIVDDKKDSFEIYKGKTKFIYLRDKKKEQETIDFLKQAHPSFATKNSFYLTFKEASKKNWFFHFFHNELKENYVLTGMDMLSYFRYSPHAVATEFKILKTIDNEIVAKMILHFGKEKIALKKVQRMLNEGQSFILLKDNSLGILSDEWMERYATIIKYSKIDGDEIIFAKWLLIVSDSLTQHQQELKFILPTDWFTKWNQWNQNEKDIYAQPPTIHAQLRNYQQKGFEWMNMMSEVNAGTLLADDMGLGKTLQTITTLNYWISENPKARIVIICPASLIYNWLNEFEKFSPTNKVAVFHGAGRSFEQIMSEEINIIISSYSIVRNDLEDFLKLTWDAVILDESHQIRNLQAKQTQAILQLNAKRRIALNGTPIMNSVSDLFPQLQFLLPQLFYSQQQFRNQFEKPNRKSTSTPSSELLRKLTNPFILRRTKEAVAPDLPAKTETIIWCEMAADQKDAYDELKSQIKENIFTGISSNGLNKSKLDVLQGITRLRQMCSTPKSIKNMREDYSHISSIKVNNLLEQLTTNLKNSKVVIFSQFLDTIDLLSTAFNENDISFLSFSGKTGSKKRMELVDEFQAEDSEIQVFLLSLMAGNSGINLTNANYVFLVEPWWNKAVQQQAIDRVHRIGQNQHVFAYNMICKDSIEEKILELQNRKQSISDEIIVDDEGFVKNLTEQDIAFLFE